MGTRVFSGQMKLIDAPYKPQYRDPNSVEFQETADALQHVVSLCNIAPVLDSDRTLKYMLKQCSHLNCMQEKSMQKYRIIKSQIISSVMFLPWCYPVEWGFTGEFINCS